MSLKNPYGLTLSLGGNDSMGIGEQGLGVPDENYNPYYSSSLPPHMEMTYGTSSSSYDHDFNTEALRNFSGNYSGLFELPESQLPELPSLSKPRSRIRDSAVLRSQQGFSVPEPPAPQPEEEYQYNQYNTYNPYEPEEPELGQGVSGQPGKEAEAGNDMPMLKLNHFVHNGYKYDGDIFELRPPQERSCNSRPERILQHKPAVLNHRQIFNRVYSEGTYNNRPSSLRQARLSIQSWNSLNLDLPLSPLSPPSTSAPHTPLEDHENIFVPNINRNSTNSSKRVSLLVENALVTKEQAMRIKVASPGAPPAQRAPRLVNHIIPQISLDEQLRAAAAADAQDNSFARASPDTTGTSAPVKKSKKSKKQKSKTVEHVIPPNKENEVPMPTKSRSKKNSKTKAKHLDDKAGKVSIESAERIRAVPHITASTSKSGGSLGSLGKRSNTTTKKKERRAAGEPNSVSLASPKPIIDSNGAPVKTASYINGRGDSSASRGILSINNQTLQGSPDGKIRANNSGSKGSKGSKNKKNHKKTTGEHGTKKTKKGFWKSLGMK